MNQIRFVLFAVVIAVIAPFASGGATYCGKCVGHIFLEDSQYPYAEDILLGSETLTFEWKTILSGCDQTTAGVNKQKVNYDSNVATNAQLRGYINIKGGTPGVRYEVRFVRKGPAPNETILEEYGWYLRQVKDTGVEQGEFFFSVARNVPAGRHRFELQARVVDGGQTIPIAERWLTVQGVPSDNVAKDDTITPSRFPVRTSTLPSAFALGGSWTSNIASTVSFTNTTKVDLFVHGYLEINGGTENDQITVGFQLNNEASSRRNSDFLVPKTFPGYATRQGINITDYIENVPALVSGQQHTLKLWAISRSGRPVTVSFRTIELVAFPTATANQAGAPYPGTQLAAYHNPTKQTVVNSLAPPEQPLNAAFQNQGWVPVTDLIDMPADSTHWLNWAGVGYIELLGRSGSWTDARAAMMIELYHYDTAQQKYMIAEIGHLPVHVPPGRGHVYFFTDVLGWGNLYGNKIRIWMRKVNATGGGTFTVGKVYTGMKLVPTTDGGCYYSSCDPSKPGDCNP